MRCFQVSILAAALGVVIAALPTTAAATTMEEAKGMCSKRGPQCVSFGLGQDPQSDIILCVDNRSTGQGVQCVRCQGSSQCSVLREVPVGGQKPGISEVEGILTESIQTADMSALEERIRTLENEVKALEKKGQ
jgi:hypothetical protein